MMMMILFVYMIDNWLLIHGRNLTHIRDVGRGFTNKLLFC